MECGRETGSRIFPGVGEIALKHRKNSDSGRMRGDVKIAVDDNSL